MSALRFTQTREEALRFCLDELWKRATELFGRPEFVRLVWHWPPTLPRISASVKIRGNLELINMELRAAADFWARRGVEEAHIRADLSG